MNKVLLYNFSGELDDVSHLFPNERLARFAGIIRDAGVDVSILDRANFADLMRYGPSFMEALGNLGFDESCPDVLRASENEAQELADGNYDTIFVYLWHGSGFKFTVDMLRHLRRIRAGITVYGIGQKVDWFTHHILDLTGNSLNGLIRGLGYDTIRHLVSGGSPESAPNLIRTGRSELLSEKNTAIAVDDYAPPLYDPKVYGGIADKIPVYPIALSNEACPNRCVYCVRPENYGRVLRKRNLENVLQEMRALYYTSGITHFRIQDSTPPRGALTELARALKNSDLYGKIKMAAFARVDVNRDEDFNLLHDVGFISMFFGIESLDPETLIRLQKGITVEAVTDTLARAHQAGIYTVGSFIFPIPGATQESMQRTLKELSICQHNVDSLLILPAGIYPPTPWGRNPQQYGITLDPDYIRKSIVYPIKYLIPLRLWKPLPFSYDLMGKPGDAVTFSDIVDAQEAFMNYVRTHFKIPPVPDHYVLLADLVRKDSVSFAQQAVRYISQRDYPALKDLCCPPPLQEQNKC